MAEFNPTIIGFACNWCCYAGADLAGTSRMKYPANLRIIRVMCSGRIDPQFLLKGVAAIRAAESQFVVPGGLAAPLAVTGYSAVSTLGSNSAVFPFSQSRTPGGGPWCATSKITVSSVIRSW